METVAEISHKMANKQWEEFEKAGYVKLGKTLNDQELVQLQNRINDYMMGRIINNDLLMQLDIGGDDYGIMSESNKYGQTNGFKENTLAYRKIQNLEQDAFFFKFMRKDIYRDICKRAYGNASISSYRAMFMNKPKDLGTVLPWHQDGGEGWGLSMNPYITVWTALDPATKDNGCVQVIPGSHQLGLLSKEGHLISEENKIKYCDESKIEYLELEPGESMVLHNLLLHRSGVNNSNISRRAFSVCYMDANTSQKESGKIFPLVFESQ